MTIMPSHKSCSDKYPAYKDSGVEWLGEIPEGWDTSRLRNVFSFSKGLTITKENLQEEGVYCVNYGEIHSKFGFEVNPEIHKLKCVCEDYLLSDTSSLLSKGDFVFADTSEDIEGSGNFTYLNSDLRTFAGYHTVIGRLKLEINERFAAYVITSQTFRNQIRRRVKGVKVFSITQSLLKTVAFWFPSKEEQTAIANFLDDKTSKIDRAIAQKEQLIALLKERKQIIIQNVVTKGLDPNVKMKDSGVEWIGEIPEEWEVIALNYGIDAVGDVDHYMPPTIDNGIPYLMTGDLKEFASHIDFDGCKKVSFRDYSNLTKKIKTEKGDVILARYATIGTSTYVDVDVNFLVSYSCVTIKPKKSKLFGLFLFYFFKTNAFGSDIRNQVNTNTQGNVGIGDLKKVKLILPTLKEQTAIVAHIETQSAKIDQAISLQQTQIEKLKEYKATLIDSAVTGKLKVVE